MELARRFEDLRVRAGLTKTALAKPRYTVSYVSQIESGRRTPSSEAMRFFAGSLGVSADYLTTGVPEDLDARLHYELETCRAELRSGMASEAEARSRAVLADAEHHGRDRLRALAQVELARALSARGAMHECVDAYEAAMEGPLSERERGRAVSSIGTAYRAVGDLTYAAEYIESYLGTRKGEPLDPQVAAELQSILVSIYFERGDVFRSERAARRALAAAESDSSPDSRALALWNASRVLAESRQLRDELRTALRETGIQTSVHYPVISRFTEYARDEASVPRAVEIAERALTLPLHPRLTEADVDLVCDALLEAAGEA